MRAVARLLGNMGGARDLNTFEALLALQEIDQGLLRQRQSYSQIALDLQDKANRLKALREKCEQAKRSQMQTEVAMKRMELERASENQSRAEMEELLYSGTEVTNPRDYYRMELRLQEHANRIDAIDQRLDPIKTAANEARQVHSDLLVQLEEMEDEWVEQKRVGTDKQARISEQYNEALKHRNETAENIPSGHLGEYTRLFKSNGGMAVTMVERDICVGCSERVSMGELNVLKQADDPILCHCGKYLITLSTD